MRPLVPSDESPKHTFGSRNVAAFVTTLALVSPLWFCKITIFDLPLWFPPKGLLWFGGSKCLANFARNAANLTRALLVLVARSNARMEPLVPVRNSNARKALRSPVKARIRGAWSMVEPSIAKPVRRLSVDRLAAVRRAALNAPNTCKGIGARSITVACITLCHCQAAALTRRQTLSCFACRATTRRTR